ncbi:hypothetical protein BU26DRAFT_60258 [Trematosphaeria pertusa]|uniref:Uncharacterized protein n=1 Tax=Trematosphaeria pertusa TaxID=390896 RepID=A0A6A6I657_9PLEO|nr:uncharacterized protein BU26DRAFT_60258 [Trematosphaeria pertusa]KAF2246025.1 hypothetical protein BU26DRAFT_60258 [Trematosphaeria pertusa]
MVAIARKGGVRRRRWQAGAAQWVEVEDQGQVGTSMSRVVSQRAWRFVHVTARGWEERTYRRTRRTTPGCSSHHRLRLTPLFPRLARAWPSISLAGRIRSALSAGLKHNPDCSDGGGRSPPIFAVAPSARAATAQPTLNRRRAASTSTPPAVSQRWAAALIWPVEAGTVRYVEGRPRRTRDAAQTDVRLRP